MNSRTTLSVLTRWVSVVILVARAVSAQAATYYIDSASGNDGNDGRSPVAAWQTLTKMNSEIFQPDDTILFKSGSSWTGQLRPKGSGSLGKPIIIDRYGAGAKPIIFGGGIIGEGVVYLYNQEYWEINDLEITNDAPVGGDRRGVLIAASNFGIVHHIYLTNLDIHDVKGIVGDDNTAKRTAGIGIETTDDLSVPTRYDDVLIEGCEIHSIDNTGIYTDNLVSGSRQEYPGTGKWPNRCFTNARIRNNVIHHISKNAMIIRFFSAGVVEHNVCYETALKIDGNTIMTSSCNGTVFQFNEGYLNRSKDADGSMYDADYRSPNTIWQYSYSHDNAHGLFWTCTLQADANIICRYNISQNDKGNISCINYPNTSVYCYNNTVYSSPDVAPVFISERGTLTGTRVYFFYNNVIYNNSTRATYDFKSSSYTRTIDYNTFYGIHPASEPPDNHKDTVNPKLVNPGSGGIGIATVSGYRLQPLSPCIDNGLIVPNNGGRDFWGVPVPGGSTPDRGASEYSQTIGISNGGGIWPGDYGLSQNFPNPFNPEMNILYQVPGHQDVTLVVYDLRGKIVRTLRQGINSPGSHSVRWDAKDDHGVPVSSGVYICRIASRASVSLIKMILVR